MQLPPQLSLLKFLLILFFPNTVALSVIWIIDAAINAHQISLYNDFCYDYTYYFYTTDLCGTVIPLSKTSRTLATIEASVSAYPFFCSDEAPKLKCACNGTASVYAVLVLLAYVGLYRTQRTSPAPNAGPEGMQSQPSPEAKGF